MYTYLHSMLNIFIRAHMHATIIWKSEMEYWRLRLTVCSSYLVSNLYTSKTISVQWGKKGKYICTQTHTYTYTLTNYFQNLRSNSSLLILPNFDPQTTVHIWCKVGACVCHKACLYTHTDGHTDTHDCT